MGFDNQELISAHLHPPLPAVGLPQYELGVLGTCTLFQYQQRQMDDENVKKRKSSPIRVVFPPVRRDSVRAR
ncbi:hypothetical protein QRX46_08530 [Bifidobacterium sp. H1HS10N]|nr:hypothetical protein [Bifidobacterium sp. H1HS10N]